MVGAGESVKHALLHLTEPIATVPANVVKTANLIIAATHKEERLLAQLMSIKSARLIEL